MNSEIGTLTVRRVDDGKLLFISDRDVYNGPVMRRVHQDDVSRCLSTAEISPLLLLCQMVQVDGVLSVMALDGRTFEVLHERPVALVEALTKELCPLLEARYHHFGTQRGVVSRSVYLVKKVA